MKEQEYHFSGVLFTSESGPVKVPECYVKAFSYMQATYILHHHLCTKLQDHRIRYVEEQPKRILHNLGHPWDTLFDS